MSRLLAGVALLLIAGSCFAQAVSTGGVRGGFNSELLGETRVPIRPPVRMSDPVVVPGSIAASGQPSEITVGVTVLRSINLSSDRPDIVFLEEISESGQFLGVVGELRDPDNDGRYTTTLSVETGAESERFFRARAPNGPSQSISGIATFAVTNLAVGFPGSDISESIETPSGDDRVAKNRVIFTSRPGVSPRRVKELTQSIGAELGTSITILGYVAGVDAYMIEFVGDGTFDAIQQVASALLKDASIREASPVVFGRPTAEWWLDTTRVSALRETVPNPPTSDTLPVYGEPATRAAIVELGVSAGVNCSSASLAGKCLPAADLAAACAGLYQGSASSGSHGSKVAQLLVGSGGSPIDGVQEGVSPEIRVAPLRASESGDIVTALDCIRQTNMATADYFHVVNMSFEAQLLVDPAGLETAVCNLACDNLLMVVSAGNRACPTGATVPYPASFNDDNNCMCGAGLDAGEYMLTVGGTDDSDALGESCTTDNKKSHAGEVFAPGWGIPNAGNGGESNNGTSFSAPLVSGCAALRGSIARWKGRPWDADLVADHLLARAKPVSGLAAPMLDCAAAIPDPYDVLLLLDRSGSMNIDDTPVGTRWEALTQTVEDFALMISQDAPPGSRIGLVVFHGNETTDLLTGLVPITENTASDVTGALSTQTPGGSTGLGQAIKNTLPLLSDPLRPQILIVFTDGEQNRPPRVVDGCGYDDSTSVSSPCPSGSGKPRIIAVGIGSPSEWYNVTIASLAESHRGNMLVANGAAVGSGALDSTCTSDLSAAFDCVVTPALFGNSLQMVQQSSIGWVPGEQIAQFDVNRSVARLLLKFSSTESVRDRLNHVRVFRGDVDITEQFQKIFGPSGKTGILKADYSKSSHRSLTPESIAGNYSVRLNADMPVLSRQSSMRMAVFADDHRLNMNWQTIPASPRVNQPVLLRMSLNWRGAPLTGARVVAKVARPGADIGDALAHHPLQVDPVSVATLGSPGRQKFDRLLRTDADFRQLLSPRVHTIELKDEQNNGIYEATFDPGDISGVYQITYEVQAASGEYGVVERQALQSVYVRIGEIDVAASIMAKTLADNSVTYVLRPITTTGRSIGPAQGSAFGLRGLGHDRSLLADVRDHQDGSYTVVISGPTNAAVSIQLFDEIIYEGPVDKLDQLATGQEKPSKGFWYWLIVVAAIIAAA